MYHSKIDELIEESVKDMISLLVAKVNVSVVNICVEYGKYFIMKIVLVCDYWPISDYVVFLRHVQFVVILESVLAKISRYDEGTLFSSFLSFTVRININIIN